jgi:hypothetical protein
MEEKWKPPEWWYQKPTPRKRRGIFREHDPRNLPSRLKLESHRQEMADNSESLREILHLKVASFTNKDVERLIKDKGIVRNRNKVCATIQNAVQFQDIKKQHGSFQKYLDSLDKSKNYAAAVNELTKRFKHLGPLSAGTFLYTVGEKIEPWDMPDERVRAAK